MLNETEIMINLQKINIKNPMIFCTSFFNTNNFIILILVLYLTSILNNNDIYKIILAVLISLILKIFFKRNRPYIINKHIKNLTNINHEKSLFTSYSLPSGHTVQATILCLILLYKYNNEAFLCLPAIIGISRIYLGVHYISDVLLAIFLSIIIYTYV
jgi:undecaprenyl-diphosphatase